MSEADDSKKEKQYHVDMPQKTPGFFLKGAGSYDWGMKNRQGAAGVDMGRNRGRRGEIHESRHLVQQH